MRHLMYKMNIYLRKIETLPVWNFLFAPELFELTGNGQKDNGFFGKQVPDIDVSFPAHRTIPDFVPAQIAYQVTIATLHNGR